jgi:hypothetical protein
MRRGVWFTVTTPVTYTEPILDDGSGPTYHEHAVLFAYTRGPSAAAVLAVRLWRRLHRLRKLPRDNRPDFLEDAGVSPFARLKVTECLAHEGKAALS